MTGQIRILEDTSLADRAYEIIRSAILEGELKPEQRFTIEDMAARLGISRTPVREALKALQGDGLVRLLPHRGAMVETYAHDEIRNRYRIKAMLESHAAELACAGDPAALAARLDSNCDRLEALSAAAGPDAGDETVREMMNLNLEFHEAIHEASGSRTLVRLLSTLRQPAAYAMNYWRNPKSRARSVEIHRKIARAFRKGDAAAARSLVEKHLTDAHERITRHIEETAMAEAQPVAKRRKV